MKPVEMSLKGVWIKYYKFLCKARRGGHRGSQLSMEVDTPDPCPQDPQDEADESTKDNSFEATMQSLIEQVRYFTQKNQARGTREVSAPSR